MDSKDTIELGRFRAFVDSGAAKSIRQSKQLSLREAGSPVDVPPSTIFRWETGETASYRTGCPSLLGVPPGADVRVSEPVLLTVLGFQRELGSLGRDTIYQLVREGRIRSVRVGRKILIPRAELTAFVERESAAEPRP